MTVCNVPTSTQVRESDLAILTQAGVEICVASTKAFTTQLAALMMLAIPARAPRRVEPGQGTGTGRCAACPARRSWRRRSPSISGSTSWRSSSCTAITPYSSVAVPTTRWRWKGRSSSRRFSYIHAEGYPAGELKHGPLALVDEDMPVVAVAPGDELVKKVRSNLQEVRARGGRLYVFADAHAGIAEADGVTVIEVPKVARVASTHRLHGTAAVAGLPHGGAQGHGRGPAEELGEVGDG